MPTPQLRRRPPRPDPLPVSAADLSVRVIGREVTGLFRMIRRELRLASGQVGTELAAIYRMAVDPKTSQGTLKRVIRGLARASAVAGAVLIVVMPLAGASERGWRFVLGVTVVSMATEMILADSWFGGMFKPKKVSLVKSPRP